MIKVSFSWRALVRKRNSDNENKGKKEVGGEKSPVKERKFTYDVRRDTNSRNISM